MTKKKEPEGFYCKIKPSHVFNDEQVRSIAKPGDEVFVPYKGKMVFDIDDRKTIFSKIFLTKDKKGKTVLFFPPSLLEIPKEEQAEMIKHHGYRIKDFREMHCFFGSIGNPEYVVDNIDVLEEVG